MSASVDVSDSLEEARTRLLRTARALVGAWAAALCAMALLVVVSLVSLLVATTVRPVYVVIWSVLLTATGYNLTRFWPRRPARPGRLLSPEERAALAKWLDPAGVVPWPDVVRLVARPELELGEDELVLGLPLVACLDRYQLRDLLRLAAMTASVEAEPSVRWALRVAHGDIGRSLAGRRPRLTWPTARLGDVLGSRAAALEADLGNWAGACARAASSRHQGSEDAQAARDAVADAWARMRSSWLDPAAGRGRRHLAPFTGLRLHLQALDELARGRASVRWRAPSGLLRELLLRHEEAVARELDDRDGLVPVDWEDHPAQVTVPAWRSVVSEALDVARRASPDPALTLDSVLRLLEEDHPAWSDSGLVRVLTPAVSVAAIDSLRFRPVWSWPDGTHLVDAEGWVLPVDAMVQDVLDGLRSGTPPERAFGALREALERIGVDVHEPLWLEEEPRVRPERPVGSFAARQRLSARLVVVTDRALHVFRDPQGARLSRLLVATTPRAASVELRKRMLTVWQGDTTDQVLTVSAAEVRRARVGPATGGLWWRITLVTDRRTVVLRGRGDGAEEEATLREWLGDRVQRSWLDAAPTVRSLRDAVGLVGVTAGTFALLWGVLLTLARPTGAPDLMAVTLALGGYGALVVAVLPDAVVELGRRLRR